MPDPEWADLKLHFGDDIIGDALAMTKIVKWLADSFGFTDQADLARIFQNLFQCMRKNDEDEHSQKDFEMIFKFDPPQITISF